MYFATNLIPVILLSATNAVDAFGIQKPFSAIAKAKRLGKTIKKVKEYSDPDMFKDRNGKYLSLPKSMSKLDRLGEILDLQISSNIAQELPLFTGGRSSDSELLEFVIRGVDIPDVDYTVIEGTPKPKSTEDRRSAEWLQIYSQAINEVIKPNRMPCEGYLYFGNQDYTKILPSLCQSDPFFASALTVSGENDEYFELNAKGDHRYAEVMKTMQDRVTPKNWSVRFNKDMTLNQIVKHEAGEAVVVPESEWNHYLSGVCYTMYYYSQCIHALIHVLHYFMTIGMDMSTKHDDSLNAWAELYDDNIVLKYIEVAAVLYDSNIEISARGGNAGKKISGSGAVAEATLGGSREVMDGPMLDILYDWGSFKNTEDFTKKFLLKGIYDTAKNPEKAIETGEILTEFKKHLANIEPFATELTAAMKADDSRSFKKAEDEMGSFMSEIGDGVSSIDSISSFVQLMSSTGMMHGSTLGFSRMTIMPEVMRWMDEESDVWNTKDTGFITQTMGTMGGMAPGRHVYTSETKYGKEWDTEDISEGVKKVLSKFDQKAEALKLAYQNEIEKRDDFRELGWTLTDHCPDGYDGRQHTLTTYI
jgi:hypothetical protein